MLRRGGIGAHPKVSAVQGPNPLRHLAEPYGQERPTPCPALLCRRRRRRHVARDGSGEDGQAERTDGGRCEVCPEAQAIEADDPGGIQWAQGRGAGERAAAG